MNHRANMIRRRLKRVLGVGLALAMTLSIGVFTGTFSFQASALGIPSQLQPQQGSGVFSVMSYNAQTNNELLLGPDNPDAALRYAQRQVEMIRDYSPDLLGTCEETQAFHTEFSNALLGYGVTGNHLFSPGYNEQWYIDTFLFDTNRIYYKQDKFSLGDSKTIWLHEGNVNQIGMIYGETNYRSATLTCLTFKGTGEKIIVVNTHLGLNASIARRQAEIMVREAQAYAKQMGVNAILYMGDFNLDYNSIPALNNSGHQCIWDSDVNSLNASGEATPWVDHIYVNDCLTIRDSYIIDKYRYGYAGDHNAIMATVFFDEYPVVLYKDADFSGERMGLFEGRTNCDDWGLSWNDVVSSIKVAPGYIVTVYEHGNYTGEAMTLGQSVSFLGNYGMNDLISAIVIEKR